MRPLRQLEFGFDNRAAVPQTHMDLNDLIRFDRRACFNKSK